MIYAFTSADIATIFTGPWFDKPFLISKVSCTIDHIDHTTGIGNSSHEQYIQLGQSVLPLSCKKNEPKKSFIFTYFEQYLPNSSTHKLSSRLFQERRPSANGPQWQKVSSIPKAFYAPTRMPLQNGITWSTLSVLAQWELAKCLFQCRLSTVQLWHAVLGCCCHTSQDTVPQLVLYSVPYSLQRLPEHSQDFRKVGAKCKNNCTQSTQKKIFWPEATPSN